MDAPGPPQQRFLPPPGLHMMSSTLATGPSNLSGQPSSASHAPPRSNAAFSNGSSSNSKKKSSTSRRGADPANQKRRCVSTACIACRKRKSKCDGALPSCAACASVYGTECVYDPNSDHRRKGVYREKIDSMKAQNSTLQILIEAILNASEEDVGDIVKKIRTCESLDRVAESILKEDFATEEGDDDQPIEDDDNATDLPVEGERELARKMGELRLENGSVRFIGGTSHLIYLGDPIDVPAAADSDALDIDEDPWTSWTEVTKDKQLIIHLMNMYFDWHYTYFTTLSKSLFYRDFFKGRPSGQPRHTVYCSALLVNIMLALGCHFTNVPGAFGTAGDSRTKGDHFFAEAKRLIVENDEYEKPRLTTVQALVLMSVREAGCGREAKGWVYSGMSFRMAQDMGLNLDMGGIATGMSDQEVDARRITFWGCFLFDKCWSNYLGRLPQLPKNTYNVPKYDVFPDEDAELWSAYTDGGFDQSAKQPSRTRAVGLQLSKLCEISSDLLLFFYHPNHIGRSSGKSVELKKLSELHRRLEDWRRELPKEFEPKEGQLPNVILMHMFFHLQYIHLFRPFLKYTPSASPLPSHVSPRRICTANASAISKLMRLYKKTYNLRQICNIAVYMVHSACTIHMLNLPEKTAKRDVIHSVKHLEEIAEDWICARRTLSILSVLARKWNVEMPEEAAILLQRTDEKYGTFNTSDVPSPNRAPVAAAVTPSPPALPGSPSTNMEERASPHPQPNSQRQYSPATHFSNSASPSSVAAELPTTSFSPDILDQLGLTGSPQSPLQTQLPKSITHPINGSSMSMGDALSAMNSWSIPAVAQQPMPNFTQTYTPVQSSFAPVQQPGRTGNSQLSSPNSIYAIDGQDWYLRDAVNWQQNFEAWGLSGQAQSPPTNGSSGTNGSSNNNNSSNGIADTPMFMFRGMRNPEMDGTFDSLSMNNLDHLPGLE